MAALMPPRLERKAACIAASAYACAQIPIGRRVASRGSGIEISTTPATGHAGPRAQAGVPET